MRQQQQELHNSTTVGGTVDTVPHKHTAMVLEPDCFHVEWRTDVQNVRIGTLLQVWQAQL